VVASSGSDLADLLTMLADFDFAPAAPAQDAEDSRSIELRHCPFLDLARDRADIVCPIHLGLMRGFLAARDSDLTVDRLEAFVEPDRCVAHLATLSA